MKELTLELTQRCLNKCIYCSSISSPVKTCNIISYDNCIKVLQEARSLGFSQLNLSGGEPFLHPDITSIIEKAAELKFKIIIYSSGIYTSYEDHRPDSYTSIPESYLKKCKKSGVEKIIFNLQCDSESMHQNITDTDLKQTCRDNSIRLSIANGIKTEVNIVPMKINLNELYSTAEKAVGLGCSKVNFLGLVMQGRALEYKDKILMNTVDDSLLQSILKELKDKYGNKIRIGNPLSQDSSAICSAGISKLVIRYDGYVYPCEAYKFFDSYKYSSPLNIKNQNLSYIVKNSEFLKEIQNHLLSCKNKKCSECPAQELLNYSCAFDKETIKKAPEYLAEKYQDSKDIFLENMESYLSSSMPELQIAKKETAIIDKSVKDMFINKNYLFINRSALDISENSYVLMTDRCDIKGYTCSRISIDEYLYNTILCPKLVNMNTYRFRNIESRKYYFYPEPVFLSPIINNDVKEKFIMQYLDSASYPDENEIKHSIAICMDSDYEEILLRKGFKFVAGTSIYKVYVYVTASQFCRANLLNIK